MRLNTAANVNLRAWEIEKRPWQNEMQLPW